MVRKLILCVLFVILSPGAAFFANEQAQAGSRDRLCCVSDLQTAYETCHDGDIVVFLPEVYGSDQLPVVAAASFCDFSKPIVWTKGGVCCVFTGRRQSDVKKLATQSSN